MKIRERDAITIAKQIIKSKKKSYHLLERLSRYENAKIDINNHDELSNFLTDYISTANVYFSYFKIDIHRKEVVELPEYISEYIKHIEILRERRDKSGRTKWALPFFSREKDIIKIPTDTYIYMYLIKGSYTLVACMEIKGIMSLNLIPTYNRIFDFSSITFLSFDDISCYIMKMMENTKLKIFNKVIEQILYSFSEQNDLYDDIMFMEMTE